MEGLLCLLMAPPMSCLPWLSASASASASALSTFHIPAQETKDPLQPPGLTAKPLPTSQATRRYL